ncbi:hypothetical protein F4680DRAFT_87377 [Xylaria scruposa]|nr:hypothetical protein F4680DRAFT_87377 [Xylaria scruposa]
MPSPRRVPRTPRQLYFAYGSNLWMKQMATRCPNSYYVGRALLPDYRWQINERGYANIVPASGFTVHGLVYELGAGDEARLDRSEGVFSGAYSKAYLPIVVHLASAALQMPTQSLVQNGGPKPVIVEAQKQMTYVGSSEAYLCPNVLVYISYDFIRRGRPRDSYIDRMNSGIGDATAMGVPPDYFDNTIRNSIPKRLVAPHVNHRGFPEPRAAPLAYSSPNTYRNQCTCYLCAGEKSGHDIDRRTYGHRTPRTLSRNFQYYR